MFLFFCFFFVCLFIKLRVLVGRKKSIRGSDVICLTFSSLGVMNGKARKQMTNVCRWQTNVVIVRNTCCVRREVSSV